MLDRAEAVVMGDGYVGFDDGEESYVNRNEYDMRVFTDEDAARDFEPDEDAEAELRALLVVGPPTQPAAAAAAAADVAAAGLGGLEFTGAEAVPLAAPVVSVAPNSAPAATTVGGGGGGGGVAAALPLDRAASAVEYGNPSAEMLRSMSAAEIYNQADLILSRPRRPGPTPISHHRPRTTIESLAAVQRAQEAEIHQQGAVLVEIQTSLQALSRAVGALAPGAVGAADADGAHAH